MKSLDFLARRTICAAMAYYSLDIALMSDAEFDLGCKRLQDEWDGLTEFRRWQFGPREELTTTGYHYKITEGLALAALRWAIEDGKAHYGGLCYVRPPRQDEGGAWSNNRAFQWWSVGDFTWNINHPLSSPKAPSRRKRSTR